MAAEKIEIKRDSKVYDKALASVYKGMEVNHRTNGIDVGLLSEINGAPPMFSDNTDPRLIKVSSAKNKYGRHYYRNFLRNAPLVFFEPGVPKFMPTGDGKWNFFDSKDDKIYKSVIQALASVDMDENSSKASDALKALQENGEFRFDSRYYIFKSSYYDYASYVNSMATIVSSKMGLGEISRVRKATPMMSSTPHARRSVGFYYDKDGSSYSESGNTTTGDSLIANIGSGASDMMREMKFIMNADVGSDDVRTSIQSSFTEKVTSMFPNGVTSFLNKMMSYTTTIMKGGNLLFPEIWKDSQFSKSVSLTFKLSSPYGDPLSIFNHIYFPILSLCALALPRQISTQGYTSPFLVHCYSKGWFNIEMGMIESITIEKGGDGNWTVDGYPLEATVTVTIKDLYNEMMLTAGSHSFFLAKNTGLTEYLTTMAGISPISHDYFTLDNSFNAFMQSTSDSINSILSSLETSNLGIGAGVVEEWAGGFKDAMSGIVDSFLKPDADKGDYEEMPGGGDGGTETPPPESRDIPRKPEPFVKKPPARPNVSPLSLKNKN